jgi:hypothetical protein
VIERLLEDPMWRHRFFSTVRRGPSAARVVSFIGNYIEAGGKIATEEFNPILNTLAGQGNYAEARSLLAIVDPDSAGSLIVDGDFSSIAEERGAGHPFEWKLTSGGAATIFIGRPPWSTDDRALAVRWRGNIHTPFAAQTLSLPPGDHLLSVSLAAERSEDEDALAIEFTCLPGANGARLTTSASRRAGRWHLVGYRLHVPAAACSAQRVTLLIDSQTAGEHGLWIDRVEITGTSAAVEQAR